MISTTPHKKLEQECCTDRWAQVTNRPVTTVFDWPRPTATCSKAPSATSGTTHEQFHHHPDGHCKRRTRTDRGGAPPHPRGGGGGDAPLRGRVTHHLGPDRHRSRGGLPADRAPAAHRDRGGVRAAKRSHRRQWRSEERRVGEEYRGVGRRE